MIEPFSATTLGGLAYDTAKTAITKWVGARIGVSIDAALRARNLKQGRPAKDQQAELTAVITAAVEETTAELFPGQQRLQAKLRKALLGGTPQEWPLVNGSDLTYLVNDVHTWIAKNDPQSGSGQDSSDPSAHPYLAVLCRNIIAQFGYRAENNGAKNTILHPRWNRFWTTELFTNQQQIAIGTGSTPSIAWPHRFSTTPPLTVAHQDRRVDQERTDTFTGGGTLRLSWVKDNMTELILETDDFTVSLGRNSTNRVHLPDHRDGRFHGHLALAGTTLVYQHFGSHPAVLVGPTRQVEIRKGQSCPVSDKDRLQVASGTLLVEFSAPDLYDPKAVPTASADEGDAQNAR